jgi:hypothetical protein
VNDGFWGAFWSKVSVDWGSGEGVEELTFPHLGGKSLIVKLDVTGLQDCSEELGIVSSLVKNQL